ncbi:MAG: flagellar protein FlaG [Xanthomonadaceae bacterium]|nr:flagellar protein FlaG [Xanthomonadaceae bacterium]
MDKIRATTAAELSGLRTAAGGQQQRPETPRQATVEHKVGPKAEAAVPAADLARAVEQINEFIRMARCDLVFSVDEATGKLVVTVVDAETREVIRQIPSEEVLAIAARLDEARGLLFETKV